MSENHLSRQGAQFLHQQDSTLHQSDPVNQEQIRRAKRLSHDLEDSFLPEDITESEAVSTIPAHELDSEVHTKPIDKIDDWMKVLERTHQGHRDDPRVLERIKTSYHRQYVIEPEQVPESAFALEAQIARNMGYGDIPITDEFRQAKTKEIISNQEESLDRWVDYLSSPDAVYPMWLKYWAFTSITKMGKLEKNTTTDEHGVEHETTRFARRTEDTVAPFPPLNPRALALTLSAIEAKASQRGIPKKERQPIDNTSTKLNDSDFAQLVSSESFSKLYAQFLSELPAYSTEGLRETRGQWVKYDQGSDAQPLVDSLEGHPLEWCTAGIETARNQLSTGDFYVYYSIDQDGNPTIPRVAIRMEQGSIAEVRGIAPDQEIDPFIADVVSEKMQEFPDGEQYQKKASDMKRLTEIYERKAGGGELTIDDLRFLYEIDNPINGFGYEKDPRIEQLLQDRDAHADLSMLLDIPPQQISLTREEALSGAPEHPIVYHYGDLDLYDLTSAEGLTLPNSIGGSLNLSSLTSAEGLTLPNSIGGSLDLYSLTNAEGLTLPSSIGGGLYFHRLTSAEGLTLPNSIGGSLSLYSLTSAEGLTLPNSIGGDLSLYSLTSAEGLTLPNSVGGNLDLHSLTSAEGLTLPNSIGGYLYLKSLTYTENESLRQARPDLRII